MRNIHAFFRGILSLCCAAIVLFSLQSYMSISSEVSFGEKSHKETNFHDSKGITVMSYDRRNEANVTKTYNLYKSNNGTFCPNNRKLPEVDDILCMVSLLILYQNLESFFAFQRGIYMSSLLCRWETPYF